MLNSVHEMEQSSSHPSFAVKEIRLDLRLVGRRRLPVEDDDGGRLDKAVCEHVLEHAAGRHHGTAALGQHYRDGANVGQLQRANDIRVRHRDPRRRSTCLTRPQSYV
jgi:hypothetical protein